ncbi:response regulator transcription factor [Aliihoeflea sp. 40Bstr573]|uniref:helix-turn-helix transcriptional regulator n=1 Tax=Aliihoeflea sp. 40Bstr573 TaxID=2696467 RepID=UPI002094AE54|nr:response regulator transcription factor [Aliihoeflea sp. 40Bstr573]MCO6386954.1 DNA-binding response regulator [Aliihoeflea sp. 40Bstr573]
MTMTAAADIHAWALFVGPQHCVPNSLLRALRSELAWLAAKHVASLCDLCRLTDHPVALVAIDQRMAVNAEDMARDLLRRYPEAMFAIMDHDLADTGQVSRLARSSRLFHSVLPMNLRLDLWLSVVGLLVNGGQYYPPSMLGTPVAGLPGASGPRSASPRNAEQAIFTVIDTKLAGLTRREFQILAIMAGGLQNKAIAARLALSEHTVKVHVHHIINKLGANNRTEAALVYRQSERAFRSENQAV